MTFSWKFPTILSLFYKIFYFHIEVTFLNDEST